MVESSQQHSPADCIAAQQSQQEQFEKIFEAYAPKIKAFCMRRGCASDLAEELTQDIMLKVWRNLESYDSEKASLRTWIFRITRNRLIDHWRQRSRPEPDPNDPNWVPSSPVSAQAHVERLESLGKLENAISELSVTQADVVHQQFFEHKSLALISKQSDVPLGTVKTRARLAMRKLREVLARRENE